MAGVDLVASGSRTASGVGGSVGGFGDKLSLRAQLDITATSGVAPTLDVVIEDTIDGTNWNVVGTFSQKTGPSREVLNITSPFTDQLRVRWTIGGTAPSFTFSVLVYVE